MTDDDLDHLFSTARIEAFSDGVFAIAITLLVLEIRVPERTDHLVASLLSLSWSYGAFVVSFLLIGLVWANHHVMFARIRATDRALLFLNTLLLMNVAFLPFVTAVLASALRNRAGESVAATAYGITLTIGGVFFNAIWEYARRRPAILDVRTDPATARLIARRFLAGPVLYALGTVISIFLPIVGLIFFAGLILFYWLPVPTEGRRPS